MELDKVALHWVLLAALKSLVVICCFSVDFLVYLYEKFQAQTQFTFKLRRKKKLAVLVIKNPLESSN